MHKIIAAVLTAVAIVPALAQTAVGVSIDIRQPGVYGRINIGGLPVPPLVVLPQPIIIAPPTVVVPRQPIYLYVPPAHQQDWRHHCGHYNACGQPVYFVQETWVRERYETRHPGWDKHDKHDKRDKHGDRHDDRDDEHGHGQEHRR